jgi:hypothetical protein
MTKEREKHLEQLLTFFQGHFTLKYHAGVEKHADEVLEDKPVLELLYDALDENLDQFAYIATAILKMTKGDE